MFYDTRRVIAIGISRYKLGVPFYKEILSTLSMVIVRRRIIIVLRPFAYLIALIRRERKYSIASRVRKFYIMRLKSRILNMLRLKAS